VLCGCGAQLGYQLAAVAGGQLQVDAPFQGPQPPLGDRRHLLAMQHIGGDVGRTGPRHRLSASPRNATSPSGG
jgi:hypothetical protein